LATITIDDSSFQNACAECADAVVALDWGTAWQKYAVAEAIASGLDIKAGDGGKNFERRERLDGLNAALASAEARVTRASDNRRIGRLGTKFQ